MCGWAGRTVCSAVSSRLTRAASLLAETVRSAQDGPRSEVCGAPCFHNDIHLGVDFWEPIDYSLIKVSLPRRSNFSPARQPDRPRR